MEDITMEFNKKIIFPIRFIDNTCCKCGAKNSIRYEQYKDGRLFNTMPIYAISSFTCEKCGTRYFINWKYDKETDDFLPIISNAKDIDSFSESIANVHNQYKRNLNMEGL